VVVLATLLGCADDGASGDAGVDASSSDAGSRDAGSGSVEDAGADAGRDAGSDSGPPPDRTVTSCDEVVVDGAADERLDGFLVFVEDREGDAVFRAPAVARPTRARFGDELLEILPRAEDLDIEGLASDCGAFAHGVASGDPEPDAVTLWTRWTGTGDAELRWTVARDVALEDVVASGVVTATDARDHAVHVRVAGLDAGETYFYRFTDPSGAASTLGRTKTASTDATNLRLAVASCSSLYSGWFNAYRRIAERDSLDLVVHLGDYIYDFVDENEHVRVPPSGEVDDPDDLESHRRRHAQYLLDPDLRAARAAHPWAVLWDNHDLERDAVDYAGGVQAFREWNPIAPQPEGAAADELFRVLRFGSLAEVYVVDMYLFQGRDALPGGADGVLGDAQYEWLTRELGASEAAWRILGMQKVFAELPPFSGWREFPEARTRLLRFLEDEGVDDNVVVTGDSHFTSWHDVVDDPANEDSPYDPSTGEGAVGVELLASSISRGNFDEQLGMGADRIIAGIRDGYLRSNPHSVDVELTSHGYGLVDVRPDRVVAEIWYSPIRAPAHEETFGGAYVCERGANRYARERLENPTLPE